MKQSSNSRRSRGRGVGKRQPKNSNFDSNGPEVRVRGSAQQVYEKYLTLARDAMAVDDRIASENYFQHAEHYFRILGAQDSGDGRDGGRNDGRGRRGRGQQPNDAHTDNGAQTGATPAEPPVVSDLAGAEQPNLEMPPQSGEAVPEEANQPAAETGQAPEQASEQAPEATVERTAAEAVAADGETDSTSGDDDGPRDSAVA